MDKIRQAYEQGLRIREECWYKTFWIKKHSDTHSIDEMGNLLSSDWDFDTKPEDWEIFHEDEPQHKPTEPTETLPETLIINGIKYTRNHDN
jgi:hypothetical protein